MYIPTAAVHITKIAIYTYKWTMDSSSFYNFISIFHLAIAA